MRFVERTTGTWMSEQMQRARRHGDGFGVEPVDERSAARGIAGSEEQPRGGIEEHEGEWRREMGRAAGAMKTKSPRDFARVRTADRFAGDDEIPIDTTSRKRTLTREPGSTMFRCLADRVELQPRNVCSRPWRLANCFPQRCDRHSAGNDVITRGCVLDTPNGTVTVRLNAWSRSRNWSCSGLEPVLRVVLCNPPWRACHGR